MTAKKLAKLKEKKEGLSISFKMLSSGADPLNGGSGYIPRSILLLIFMK